MPELPEVETVRRQIAPLMVGRRIERCWVGSQRLVRRSSSDFSAAALGQQITNALRHGKQLYFPLASGAYLLMHLGMTGRISFVPNAEFDPDALGKHVHAWLEFDDGAVMLFSDPRIFGHLAIAGDLSFLSNLGPEPLNPDFDGEVFALALHRRAIPIKAALLDQRLVAGIGSIYADEICFLAGVHPLARACDLSGEQLARIAARLRPVLERAVEAGGATLKDGGYEDLFGRAGRYYPYVYGRTGDECPNECGATIRYVKLGSGRSARPAHYCPVCQPFPLIGTGTAAGAMKRASRVETLELARVAEEAAPYQPSSSAFDGE